MNETTTQFVLKPKINRMDKLIRIKAYNLQKQRSRLAFGIRCFILFAVVIVFFIRYLLDYQIASSVNANDADELPSHSRLQRSVPNFNFKFPSHYPRTKNCTTPAIDEFPSDGLTRSERKHGWIVVHIAIAVYCFWLLAIVCDEYFMPALELLCENLNCQKDVIGATIMAAATSSPELFMNILGTFVTKGDIGVGAIVGSSVFNILAVPACCGLFVTTKIQLHWWSLVRDSTLYCLAVLGLIATLYDGRIMWYEALLLLFGYILYLTVMSYNDAISSAVQRLIARFKNRKQHIRGFREVSELTPLLYCSNNNSSSKFSLASEQYENLENNHSSGETSKTSDLSVDPTEEAAEFAVSPWNCDSSNWFAYLMRWPITTLLWLTIPDSRKYPNLKYLTFTLSIVWSGAGSFLVGYAITIIGDTLDIPDSVMGLTILAAGMSLPEAVSSIIVTKQGQGAMGISNSIGSNTYDILLCLSLPWFVKAAFVPEVPGEHWITLNSSGITYSAIFLLTTLFGLYISFAFNKFVLDRRIGFACSVMYVLYLVVASLMELNVFFPVNLPICEH